MVKDIELPKKGKSVFKPTDNYFEFSYLQPGNVNSQFYAYIKGYKDTADKLVDFAINSKNISTLDTYIFPIIFLYRQFIELSLKSLYLEYADDLMSDKIQTIKESSHNLAKMWGKLKPTLIDVNNTTENTMISTVESYIMEYHLIDKTSFRFRYPIDKDMNPLILNEERIDILNLKDCMTELDNYFSGYDGKLDSNKEAQYEKELYMTEVESDIKADAQAELEQFLHELQAEAEAEMRADIDY